MAYKLDSTDKKILNILQENSRLTNKELASKLNLSITPVYERVKRLDNLGFIKKYVALVDADKIGVAMLAFCNVQLKEHSKKFLETFEKEIMELEEVVACWHIAGVYDYLLKVVVKDMGQYEEFVKHRLAALENIANVQSSFVMTEVKRTTAIPIK